MPSTTLTLNWIDRKGRDCDCDIEVEFTIWPGGFQDAEDDIRITSTRTVGECDLEQWTIDEMLYDALEEHVRENYDDYMEE